MELKLWIVIVSVFLAPAFARALPCGPEFSLLATKPSSQLISMQNRQALLRAGFVQQGTSQIYVGKGFLVRLLEDGTPVLYTRDGDQAVFWGVGTTSKKSTYDGRSWDRNSVDFYSSRGNETHVHSILTSGSASGPVADSAVGARRETPILTQISETPLVEEPSSRNTVFSTVGKKDWPELIAVVDGAAVDVYLPVGLRYNSGYNLDFTGAAVVGMKDGGLEINDGVVATVITGRGFVQSRRVGQNLGDFIETTIEAGYTPALLSQPTGVPELAFKSNGALVGPKDSSLIPLESRSAELKNLLAKSDWAKGNKVFQGDMLNAPFVAEGSTMEAIIARDETRVKDLGQSNKKIGSLLAVLRGLTDKVNQFDWGGRSFKVRLVSGRVVQVTNTATDQTFSFRVEHPELVYLYGFFGDPKTKSRIDPEKIVEFFGLK